MLMGAIIMVSLTACSLGGNKTADTTTTPPVKEEVAKPVEAPIVKREAGQLSFTYPDVTLTAAEGDYVLAPSQVSVDEAFQKKEEKPVFIFYAAKVVTVGEKESTLEDLAGSTNSIPNALIVPIKPNQTSVKGDILLTWWQSGSGLMRAIVTEGGERPKVRYLDDFAKEEETLESDSFHKLTGVLEPGASVAVKDGASYRQATLINVSGSKAIINGWGGSTSVVEASTLKALPVTFSAKVGDEVMAPVIGTYDKVIVKSIDAAVGQVVAEYEFAGEMSSETFFFGDVVKDL